MPDDDLPPPTLPHEDGTRVWIRRDVWELDAVENDGATPEQAERVTDDLIDDGVLTTETFRGEEYVAPGMGRRKILQYWAKERASLGADRLRERARRFVGRGEPAPEPDQEGEDA